MLDLKSLKLSPYTLRLIKQHIAYAIACVFFIGITISVIPYQITTYFKARAALTKTNKEIKEFSLRAEAIQSYPAQDLADLVLSMNSLYPSDEDRFSIFNALDNLQTVTGIDIVSYSSPFAGKTFREISIPIKAHASLDAFKQFLIHHVYKSGRFMTISKVTYSQEDESLAFTATFHNRRIEVNTKKPVKIEPELIIQAQTIAKEVQEAGFVMKNQDASDSASFEPKSNPFQ